MDERLYFSDDNDAHEILLNPYRTYIKLSVGLSWFTPMPISLDDIINDINYHNSYVVVFLEFFSFILLLFNAVFSCRVLFKLIVLFFE